MSMWECGAVWTDSAETIYKMWIVFNGDAVLKNLNL